MCLCVKAFIDCSTFNIINHKYSQRSCIKYSAEFDTHSRFSEYPAFRSRKVDNLRTTCQFKIDWLAAVNREQFLRKSQDIITILVVSTHLKNMSQNGNLPAIFGVKIKNMKPPPTWMSMEVIVTS